MLRVTDRPTAALEQIRDGRDADEDELPAALDLGRRVRSPRRTDGRTEGKQTIRGIGNAVARHAADHPTNNSFSN